jgi:long-chain acyl-CoA synthetase
MKTDIDQLFQTPDFLAAVQKSLNQFGKDNDLKGFEIAKDVHYEMEMFSVENNLLTPSFKLKRNEAKVKYQSHINRMYAESQNK